MDIETMRTFFLWSTVLNAALFFLSFFFTTVAGGWVYRIHSRIYPLSREQFNATIYALMGLYKIVIIVFNLVPYIALEIVG